MAVSQVNDTFVVIEGRCRLITMRFREVDNDGAVIEYILGYGISSLDLGFGQAATIVIFVLDPPGGGPTLIYCDVAIYGFGVVRADKSTGVGGREGGILGSPVGVGKGAELGTN